MDAADTLVIASGAALPYAEREVNAIVNSGLRVHILEDATRQQILDAAKREEIWTRWWFVAHGDQDGVHLTDGIMSTALLTQYARRAGIEFMFLNTCASEFTARLIQQELGITLICTLGEIDDYTAYSTGALLAEAIARTGDYYESYVLSKPGQNRDYLFLPEMTPPSRSSGNDQVSQNNERIARNNERIAKVEGRLSRLERIVFGDPDMGTNAVRTELSKLGEGIDSMNRQLSDVRSKLDESTTPPKAWQVVLAIGVSLLLATGALLQIFGSLGWVGG